MKNKMIIPFFLMITGVLLLGYFAPWWAAAMWVVLVSALLKLPTRKGILLGGVSIGIVWLGMSLWMSSQDDTDIIGKTGTLLGGLSAGMMMVVTVFMAIVTGVLSGWFGSRLGDWNRKHS